MKRKLTEFEKEFLKLLSKRYKYIARDENGELYVYSHRPHKSFMRWTTSDIDFSEYVDSIPTMGVFEFIYWKDKEPYSIEELLKED